MSLLILHFWLSLPLSFFPFQWTHCLPQTAFSYTVLCANLWLSPCLSLPPFIFLISTMLILIVFAFSYILACPSPSFLICFSISQRWYWFFVRTTMRRTREHRVIREREQERKGKKIKTKRKRKRKTQRGNVATLKRCWLLICFVYWPWRRALSSRSRRSLSSRSWNSRWWSSRCSRSRNSRCWCSRCSRSRSSLSSRGRRSLSSRSRRTRSSSTTIIGDATTIGGDSNAGGGAYTEAGAITAGTPPAGCKERDRREEQDSNITSSIWKQKSISWHQEGRWPNGAAHDSEKEAREKGRRRQKEKHRHIQQHWNINNEERLTWLCLFFSWKNSSTRPRPRRSAKLITQEATKSEPTTPLSYSWNCKSWIWSPTRSRISTNLEDHLTIGLRSNLFTKQL